MASAAVLRDQYVGEKKKQLREGEYKRVFVYSKMYTNTIALRVVVV